MIINIISIIIKILLFAIIFYHLLFLIDTKEIMYICFLFIKIHREINSNLLNCH